MLKKILKIEKVGKLKQEAESNGVLDMSGAPNPLDRKK